MRVDYYCQQKGMYAEGKASIMGTKTIRQHVRLPLCVFKPVNTLQSGMTSAAFLWVEITHV